MTKNQKIALGCGGAGCLGLIAVAIAGAAFYFLLYSRPAVRRVGRDYNVNVNLNDNSSNANASTPNVNASSNTSSNSNSNANSNSSSSSASSLSDDDKHKLFQAASMTGDGELVRRVLVKIGLMNEDFTPGDNYSRFMGEHMTWGAHNYDFIQTINTPEKARAYVNAHFPE
jgi:hypothetical protein